MFDYSEPLENYPPERRAHLAAVNERVAAIAEPWLSHFDPVTLMTKLRGFGFQEVKDLGLADIATRYFGAPADRAAPGAGPHLMRAANLRNTAKACRLTSTMNDYIERCSLRSNARVAVTDQGTLIVIAFLFILLRTEAEWARWLFSI